MLIFQDGGFYNGPEPEDTSIDALQADRLAHVDRVASAMRNKIVGSTHPAEMASWPIKLAQAQLCVSSQELNTPLLDAEAAARGVAREALAARILTNAQLFAGAEALIAGAAGAHRDAIKALDTADAVTAYDFRGGWPDLG